MPLPTPLPMPMSMHKTNTSNKFIQPQRIQTTATNKTITEKCLGKKTKEQDATDDGSRPNSAGGMYCLDFALLV